MPLDQLEESFRLPFAQVLPMAAFGFPSQHVGDQAVAALPDLPLDTVGWNAVPELRERLGPRRNVGRIAVEERTVDIKNQRVQHRPKIGQCRTR